MGAYLLKRAFKLVVMGAVGGILVFGAYILFVLPGGLRAYLEKRTDFAQLYVYNVGEKFVDINFRRLDGRKVRLSQYPHKAVLVNFFASWSAPCDAEAPRLERLSQTYRSQGLLVIGVDVNEAQARARAYQQKHHLTFPVWLVEYTVEGGFHIPFDLVIDAQGVVRFSGSDQPRDMEQVIVGLLGK